MLKEEGIEVIFINLNLVIIMIDKIMVDSIYIEFIICEIIEKII